MLFKDPVTMADSALRAKGKWQHSRKEEKKTIYSF